MADPIIAETTPSESAEIPAYVVRPNQPRDYRRQGAAPAPSLLKRLSAGLVRRRSLSVQGVVPAAAASEHDATSAVRYEATVGPKARKFGLAHAAGLAVMAGGLVVAVIAAQSAKAPAPVASASAAVSPAAVAVSAPAADAGPAQPIQAKRIANVTYVVRSGDTFTSVGAQHGVTPRTVRLVNELPLGAHLQEGQKLVIPPSDGAYHRIAKGETIGALAQRYGVSEAAIRKHNPGLNPRTLQLGQKIFIPGATALLTSEGTRTVRGYRPGAFATRLSASRSLIGEFGSRVGQLAWPAEGDFSSAFGVRGTSFHPGVDISAAIGTPIHAAKDGTVLASGWMGAYGYAIDLDHGGGVVTRYGHCSKLLVSAGEKVKAGQEIGKVGSTGRSTGPHVHFEVRIQGRAVNPANFF